MSTPAIERKIIINFGWIGPSRWSGLDADVVDLVFKNAKTNISVSIPGDMSSSTVTKLPFTFRRYQENELKGPEFKPVAQETHPDSLKVTIEQIRNLTIKASILKESPNAGPAIMEQSGNAPQEKRVLRSDREIKIDVPETLEIGQTYRLIVAASPEFSFSACLQKEENTNETALDDDVKTEFQSRMIKMGEALISEGNQNLNLSASVGRGVFNSSSTNADVLAHVMQGVFRSGQQVHPEIQVPNTRPSETPSDLDKLSTEELQSRLEATFIKDKQLEKQRMQFSMANNIQETNKAAAEEHANSQLLLNLAEALERKGVEVRIPRSESFQSAADESAEMLNGLKDTCKTQ